MQINASSMAEAEAEAQLRPKFHNLDMESRRGRERNNKQNIA